MQTLRTIHNYTINVLSKCSNVISHRSSVFEGRHIDHPSSKVDTSIIDPRKSTHRSSIFESRHVDLRRSTHRSSKLEGGNIALTFQQFVTEYCPQRRSIVIPNIPRGTHNIRRRYTRPYTYIRRQPYTCTNYVLYAYLYCIYPLVDGAISIRDPYIRAILRVCANESHGVFHKPVVCAVKT